MIRITKTGFITIFYLLALAGLLWFSFSGLLTDAEKSLEPGDQAATADVETSNTGPTGVNEFEGVPFLSKVFQLAEPKAVIRINEIFARLFAAVILTAFLAFRPKKTIPLFKRNFHVIQTQILLAVVAASLMMIVGNNAARAFAIFAAVSLVRFRTNIRNPKEVTVLLVSLAIGLASGVGYWQLGMILCFFVMTLLWFLEYSEDEQSFRSMEVTVRTRNPKKTRVMLQQTFTENDLEWELRRIDLPDVDEEIARFTYLLNLRLDLSTHDLTTQIMGADYENISDVNWSHKRKALQIYE